MSKLFNSCAVSQNKGRIQLVHCEALKNYISALNHQCKLCVLLLLLLAWWSSADWCGLQTLGRAFHWETTIPHRGWWPLFSLNCKNMRGAETPLPLCVAEGGGKKSEKKVYHLLFKWNEVRQMVEEGLWARGWKPPALYLCDFSQPVTK